jgi:hypothetical protein
MSKHTNYSKKSGDNRIRYRRYQLIYPYEGVIVHKSKSKAKAIKKCYKEFKRLNGVDDGLFSVADLDNNIEYQFKVRHNKIMKLNENKYKKSQLGGNQNSPDTPRLVSPSKNNNVPMNIYSSSLVGSAPSIIPGEIVDPEVPKAPLHKVEPEVTKPTIPKIEPEVTEPKVESEVSVPALTVSQLNDIKAPDLTQVGTKIEELQELMNGQLETYQDKVEGQLSKYKTEFENLQKLAGKEQLSKYELKLDNLQKQMGKEQLEMREQLVSQYKDLSDKIQEVIDNCNKEQFVELPQMRNEDGKEIDEKIAEIHDQIKTLNEKDENYCIII